MGERRSGTDMADMLDRVARGLIVESALPVSPTVDELRRVEGPEPPGAVPAGEPPPPADRSVAGDESLP